MEDWKEVIGYDGKYMVSDLGNIKSFQNGKEKILKQSNDSVGYKLISLYKNGVQTMFKVHRLVATAFISNYENKPQVNHKDGIKSNNKLSNLEWATRSENIRHAYDNNLIVSPFGQNHPGTLLQDEDVYDIKILLLAKYKQKYIATIFNTTVSAINHIHRSKSWTHIEISSRLLDKYKPHVFSKPKKDPYKISETDPRLKPIYMIDIATNKILKEYPSSISAKKDGYNEIVLSRCLCGRRPRAYGAKWIFKNQYSA